MATKAKKYCVLFDHSPNHDLQVYFNVTALNVEMNYYDIAEHFDAMSKQNAVKDIRKNLIQAMLWGKMFVLYHGDATPDYLTGFTDSVNLPMERIFDFEHWQNPHNHKSILYPGEDVDLHGVEGNFKLSDDFTIVIYSYFKDDNHIQETLDRIPTKKDLQVYVVEPLYQEEE